MSGFFSFGSISSLTFGADIFPAKSEIVPATDYTEVTIPGKDGTLLLPNNRLKNVEHKYSGIIYGTEAELKSRLAEMKRVLKSVSGYQDLTDSFNPDEIYKAVYKDELSVTINRERTMAKFILTFVRKPQRYLVSGASAIALSSSEHIDNPTGFAAKPKIVVYSSGQETESELQIGSTTATITWDEQTNVTIDCEAMNCYTGVTNMNGNVAFNALDFPDIPAGGANIAFGSGITSVSLTPRWYRL